MRKTINPEILIIDCINSTTFRNEIADAINNGFIVLASNAYVVTYDDEPGTYTCYYALLKKESVEEEFKPKEDVREFYYKIIEELNAIKFHLSNIEQNSESL